MSSVEEMRSWIIREFSKFHCPIDVYLKLKSKFDELFPEDEVFDYVKGFKDGYFQGNRDSKSEIVSTGSEQ